METACVGVSCSWYYFVFFLVHVAEGTFLHLGLHRKRSFSFLDLWWQIYLGAYRELTSFLCFSLVSVLFSPLVDVLWWSESHSLRKHYHFNLLLCKLKRSPHCAPNRTHSSHPIVFPLIFFIYLFFLFLMISCFLLVCNHTSSRMWPLFSHNTWQCFDQCWFKPTHSW